MKLSDAKETQLPEGAKAHKFDDVVTVIGHKDAKHLKPGKEYKVHKVQAAELIKKGEATKG
jgi:hypothetical protein